MSRILLRFSSTKFVRVIVSFKDDHMFSAKISASNNFTGFIAVAGSLICLFMGASLLSIIELLYYFTVRIYIAYENNKRIKPVARIETILFEPQNQRPQHQMHGQGERPVFTYLP